MNDVLNQKIKQNLLSLYHKNHELLLSMIIQLKYYQNL